MKIPLLILHGAIGSRLQFLELEEKLSSKMEVYSIDLPGHGKEKITDEEYSIEMFANFILEWMQSRQFDQIDIFGYSMGGYVAIYLAANFPEKVSRVFTLATKFNWSKEIAAREIKLIDPETIREKLPEFAETLKKRHLPNDWERILNKTATMLSNMGKKNPLSDEDLRKVNQKVLIGMGDRDNMVIIEESVYSYRLLKNGQLLVLPDTPHPFEKIPLSRIVQEITSFFN